MSRSPGWTHPRKRPHKTLGPCEVTYHALDSYRSRIAPEAGFEELEPLCRAAYLIGRKATGEYVYRATGCRLIVHKPARRMPVVLTIVEGEGRHT